MASLLALHRRSRALLVGLLLVALLGTTAAVVAAVVTSNNGPFTGCLSKGGTVYDTKAGPAPLAPCRKGDTQIAFGNGQGVQGIPGTNGFNALIKTTPELPGANCTNGGTKTEAGLDDGLPTGTASNGTLEPGEVDSISYVCNGANGAAGGPGNDPCAAMVGTYFGYSDGVVFDSQGNPIPGAVPSGTIISLYAGGGMSVAVMVDPHGVQEVDYTEEFTDQQGAWTCDGNNVSGRTVDVDIFDQSSSHPPHEFSVDRRDWTASLSQDGKTLSVHRELCWFDLPLSVGVDLQTSPCTAATGSGTPLDFTARRVTQP